MDFRWEQGIKKLPDLTAKVGNYLQTTTTSSRGGKLSWMAIFTCKQVQRITRTMRWMILFSEFHGRASFLTQPPPLSLGVWFSHFPFPR